MEVDDPGAFTTKWSARQRWVRRDKTPLEEIHCNENNEDFFNLFPMPSPKADKPASAPAFNSETRTRVVA